MTMRKLATISGWALIAIILLVSYLPPLSGPPNTIMIHGTPFHVYYSDTVPKPLIGDNGHRLDGQTFCDFQYIQVSPGQDEDEMRDTLWHEAKHAANDCTELSAKTYDKLYESEVPQELILLQENPRLVRYLSKGHNELNQADEDSTDGR